MARRSMTLSANCSVPAEFASSVLAQSFFERDTIRVAQDLLGKLLVVCSRSRGVSSNARVTVCRIV